jgi:hypothetical protein
VAVLGEELEVGLAEELEVGLAEESVAGLAEELEVGLEEESAVAREGVLVELVLTQTQILHTKLELCIER